GQRVGADHDSPLRLVAEAVVAGAHRHLAEVDAAGAVAEADAVVTGEVRRGLGGSDQVVAGQAVLDGARQLALRHLGAELAAPVDRALDGRADARLDALRLVELPRDADADSV